MTGFIALCTSMVIIYNLSLLLGGNLSKSQFRMIKTILLFVFATVLAFRPETTPDTTGYIETYQLIVKHGQWPKSISLTSKYNGYEIGFWLIIFIFGKIGIGYRAFFFIIALSTMYFIPYYLCRLVDDGGSETEFIITTLYITCFAIHYSGIALRAGLSMMFGIGGLYYLLNKKYIRTLVFIFIAFTMQAVSLIFIFCGLILLLLKRKNIVIKEKFFLLWLINAIFCMAWKHFNYIDWLKEKILWILSQVSLERYYYSYLGNISGTELGVTKVGLIVCVFCVLSYLSMKKIQLNKWCVFNAVIGFDLIFFLAGARAANRLYDYFLILGMLPIMAEMYKVGKQKRKLGILNAYYLSNFIFCGITYRNIFL